MHGQQNTHTHTQKNFSAVLPWSVTELVGGGGRGAGLRVAERICWNVPEAV